MPTKWNDENKDRLRKYRREWYYRNREHAKSKINERIHLLREWMIEYKSSLECKDCKTNHPAVLHFHHRDPTKKEVELSAAVKNGWSKERMIKEIEKCDVLCSNCHLIFHWTERQNRRAAGR